MILSTLLATIAATFHLAFVVPAVHAEVAQWTCENVGWVTPPTLKKDIFKGDMISVCLISNTHGQGLKSLNAHFIKNATLNAEVHQGPLAEMFHDLPGYHYEVTEKLGKGGDTLVVRQDLHIATDEHTRLAYGVYSSKITASGLAGYVRNMSSFLEVTPGSEPGAFLVTMQSGFVIAQPWYIPDGIFKPTAEDIALTKFREARISIMTDIARSL